MHILNMQAFALALAAIGIIVGFFHAAYILLVS